MKACYLNACRCEIEVSLEAPTAVAVAGRPFAALPQLKRPHFLTVLRNSLWHEETCGFVTSGTRIGTSIPRVGTAKPPICHLKSGAPPLVVTADTVTAIDIVTAAKVTESLSLADAMEASHA